MKKSVICFLAAVLIFSFTGCANNKTAANESFVISTSVVVLPDADTFATVNGYKKETVPSEQEKTASSSSLSVSETVSADTPETEVYCANKNTKKFHKSSCQYVPQIKESNLKIFESRDDAIAEGYVPCAKCNP